MQPRKKIVAISGMPGAGKGIAAEGAREMGYEVFACGDVIREEAKNLGLQPTRKTLADLMLQVRSKEGPSVVAKRLTPKIESSSSDLVVVDGIRSPEETDELRSKFNVVTVAIHASPQTRYMRMRARNRSDDPKTWTEFVRRDEGELDVGLGQVISAAETVLDNEGTITQLKSNIHRYLRKLKGS